MGDTQRTFEEVVSNPMWKPEKENDEFEGEVMEFKKGLYSERQAVVKAPSGDLFNLPSYTVLENKMATIEVGDYIKVTYVGTKKSDKGVEYKDFKLEKAK